MDSKIIEIDAQKTLEIRQRVMWPDAPLDVVKLPHDKNGTHYGLYLNQKLISVVSVFKSSNEVQFRKFATLQEFQGKGFGSQLLTFLLHTVEEEKFAKIWCNARVGKINFYEKFGLKQTPTVFEKNGINYVIMEKIF